MTTESSKNGATTLSRMNLSGYVAHVRMMRLYLVECFFVYCRIGDVWLAGGYAHALCYTFCCHCDSPAPDRPGNCRDVAVHEEESCDRKQLLQQRQRDDAGRRQFQEVGDRGRTQRRVRATLPADDVTRESPHFRSVALLPVSHCNQVERRRLGDGHAASGLLHDLDRP